MRRKIFQEIVAANIFKIIKDFTESKNSRIHKQNFKTNNAKPKKLGTLLPNSSK